MLLYIPVYPHKRARSEGIRVAAAEKSCKKFEHSTISKYNLSPLN